MGQKSKREVQARVDTYVRNLKAAGLATEAELESVAKLYKGGTKDDIWEWLVELRSLARVRKATTDQRSGHKTVDALEAAIAALEGRAEMVELKSIGRTVKVVPASWARIMLVEDINWWIMRLTAAHVVFKNDEAHETPLHELDQILDRILSELSFQRSRLYALVTAPTPAPVDHVVDWADDITPIEDMALVQAWHRVNMDLMTQLPQPRSRDGVRNLPTHWSFVFQSVAWRERRPPEEIIRDRSLVSIVTSTVLEALKSEAADKRSKGFGKKSWEKQYSGGDEDDIAEALGIDD